MCFVVVGWDLGTSVTSCWVTEHMDVVVVEGTLGYCSISHGLSLLILHLQDFVASLVRPVTSSGCSSPS